MRPVPLIESKTQNLTSGFLSVALHVFVWMVLASLTRRSVEEFRNTSPISVKMISSVGAQTSTPTRKSVSPLQRRIAPQQKKNVLLAPPLQEANNNLKNFVETTESLENITPSGTRTNANSSLPESLYTGTVLNDVKVEYPRSARRRGLEGTVVVRMSVDANGTPKDVTLESSSGHAILDEAALKAAAQLRFTPFKARINSHLPIFRKPFVFEIRS